MLHLWLLFISVVSWSWGFGVWKFLILWISVYLKNPLLCSFFVFFLPRLVLEFNLMSYAFGKLTVAMWTWFTMFICTLTVPYFLFQRWARGYHRTSHPVVYSFIHCFLFVVFQTGVLGIGPLYVVLAYTLPPASRCIVILEQVRFWVCLVQWFA